MIDTRVLPEDHFDFMSVSESVGVELYKIVCALNRRTKLGELVWKKVTEENHDLVLPCNSKIASEVYECDVDDRKFIFRYGGADSPALIVQKNSGHRISFNLNYYLNIFYHYIYTVGRGVGESSYFYIQFKQLAERFVDTLRHSEEQDRLRTAQRVRILMEKGSETHVQEFDSEVEEDVAPSKDLYGDAGQYLFSAVYERQVADVGAVSDDRS